MSEGYSTALRWEGVAKADAKPRMRHNGREAEEEAGIMAVHSNELINAAMTARNESYIWRDGVREPLTGPDPIGLMHEVAEARWSQAQHARLNKKTGKYTERAAPSNASHVAEFVLQLDPKFTGPSWSQFEDTFEDGATAYLEELEHRVEYFAEALERAQETGVDIYDAGLDAKGAQIELQEGREDVDRWRGSITERREATDILLRAMIDKVHEWMDGDGTKANLVSDHIHRDETSPHAQIFAVPLGAERDLPGGVTERKLSLKQLLVGNSTTRSEAQHRYSERHDEMRNHINDVARAHDIDYVATMERVDNQRQNLNKTQLRRHKAEQLRQRVHDKQVADNVVEAGERLTKLAEREKALQDLESTVAGREVAVGDAEEKVAKLITAADDTRRSLDVDREALAADREKYTAEAAVLGTAQKNFANNVASFQADLEKFRVAKSEVEANMSDVIALADKLEELQKELDHRESVVADQEKTLRNREDTVAAEEATLPELKRRAQVEGYEVGKTEGLQASQETAEKIRMQAVSDAQRAAQQAAEAAQRVRQAAQEEAERKRQQAEIDAQTIRSEAERIKTYAEAVRGAADMTMAEAKDALTKAQQLLRTAQEVTPPKINEIEFKRQMNTVDADFLGQLCEKNPKIAQSRENYRTQRRRKAQWGTPEQQAALEHTVGQAQELAQKRFGARPDSPKSPQKGRQHGHGPKY